jgi:large subunit ribosomal protein L22
MELQFLAKRAGAPIRKAHQSAVANAENLNIRKDNLFIKELRVDSGVTIHRSMPRARGRAFPIKKRSSHVLVVLDEKAAKTTKK